MPTGKETRIWQTPYGFSPETWSLLGELGIIATAFNEADGGFETDIKTLTVIFEAFGRGITAEPLIEYAYEAGALFAATASPELKSAWIDQLVSGEKRLALAHTEQRARDNPLWVEVTATPKDDGFSLTGSKSLVPSGVGVDGYIISSKSIDGSEDDLSLFLGAVRNPGLTSGPIQTCRWARCREA